MYEELIKKLRNDAKAFTGFVNEDLLKAADAIVDLEKCLAIALLEYQTANNKWLMTEEYAKQKLQWIPVTERLPEDGAEVLAFNKTGFAYVDCWTDGKWKINSMVDEEHESVTYWMPLPEPPKEG